MALLLWFLAVKTGSPEQDPKDERSKREKACISLRRKDCQEKQKTGKLTGSARNLKSTYPVNPSHISATVWSLLRKPFLLLVVKLGCEAKTEDNL